MNKQNNGLINAFGIFMLTTNLMLTNGAVLHDINHFQKQIKY